MLIFKQYLRLEINEIPVLFIRVAFFAPRFIVAILRFYTFLLAKANFSKSITNDVNQKI